jgi:hypothetical protein
MHGANARPTGNGALLCLQHFRDADAGHGSLDQYPERFGDHVRSFLNGG